ncbi:uncharacterized protein [Hemitrygon akajei]|uniref:uncharacterized protein isoform X1 n=1 Tax=Hemitrygon akajei TaxID=2704970 RepID=UPI003BF952F0
MAECEVCGELVEWSGRSRRYSVRVRRTIPGILTGVRSLLGQLGGALNDLVLQEKQADTERTASGSGGFAVTAHHCSWYEEDDEDDEGEDEGNGDAPPTKRTRTQS